VKKALLEKARDRFRTTKDFFAAIGRFYAGRESANVVYSRILSGERSLSSLEWERVKDLAEEEKS